MASVRSQTAGETGREQAGQRICFPSVPLLQPWRKGQEEAAEKKMFWHRESFVGH